MEIIADFNAAKNRNHPITQGRMKSLVDSIDAALKNIVTAGHKGVQVASPFVYQCYTGAEVSILPGRVPRTFRDMKVWALEKLEEVVAEAKQQLYDTAERTKRAAKQTSLDLTSEKIPELTNILPGADNNLADWMFT